MFRRPFNILGPDIAAIMEDQILRTPGDDDFAIYKGGVAVTQIDFIIFW